MIRCRGPPTHVNPTYEVIKMIVLMISFGAEHFQTRARGTARAIACQILKNSNYCLILAI